MRVTLVVVVMTLVMIVIVIIVVVLVLVFVPLIMPALATSREGGAWLHVRMHAEFVDESPAKVARIGQHDGPYGVEDKEGGVDARHGAAVLAKLG